MLHYRLGPPLDARIPSLGNAVVRIGANAGKCVVFFGVDGEGVDNIEYGGTGTLLINFEDGLNIPVLVTCRHVAEALSKHPNFYIRANTLGGQSLALPIQSLEWAYPEDKTIDLAATTFTLPAHTFDVIYYRLNAASAILTNEDVARIHCGEPISLIGLFRLHPGKQRNISCVHTGNIAVLPDSIERIPIRDRTTNEIVEAEVYLVEAQTLDGLSGSPVFLHEIIDLQQINLELRPQVYTHPKAIGIVKLLGIYTGSWDGEPGKILAADRNFHGKTRVPIGMGTVVPIDKVGELIRNHPIMKKKNKEFTDAILAQRAASQDSAIPDPPSGVGLKLFEGVFGHGSL